MIHGIEYVQGTFVRGAKGLAKGLLCSPIAYGAGWIVAKLLQEPTRAWGWSGVASAVSRFVLEEVINELAEIKGRESATKKSLLSLRFMTSDLAFMAVLASLSSLTPMGAIWCGGGVVSNALAAIGYGLASKDIISLSTAKKVEMSLACVAMLVNLTAMAAFGLLNSPLMMGGAIVLGSLLLLALAQQLRSIRRENQPMLEGV